MPPSPLKVAFYADDFTGSTEALEALCLAGLKTLLFLDPPDAGALEAHPGLQAAGIAGRSRTLGPEAMEKELTPAFEALRALAPPLVHYKVCSTFDSSASVGSIGKACDLGRTIFGSAFVPMLVAVPPLGRYSVFGNLFAKAALDGDVFRLDRHPVMAGHPVTPMGESDLIRHLAGQTGQTVALFDVLKLQGAEATVEQRFAEVLADEPDIVLFDALLETHMARIGGLLWKAAEKEGPLFAVGSSGLEYALSAHWRQAQPTAPTPAFCGAGKADRMAVISGSFSAATSRQIQRALGKGFAGLALEPLKLLGEGGAAEISKAADQALKLMEGGKSVVLHTALGPADARVKASTEIVKKAGPEKLGRILGGLLKSLVEKGGLKRAAVIGGDTAWFVARELGLKTLEAAGPIHPGSPLCRAGAPGTKVDGLEILFKEGQTGKDDIFETILAGKP